MRYTALLESKACTLRIEGQGISGTTKSLLSRIKEIAANKRTILRICLLLGFSRHSQSWSRRSARVLDSSRANGADLARSIEDIVPQRESLLDHLIHPGSNGIMEYDVRREHL